MKPWYKVNDIVYTKKNMNIFGTRIKYNNTPFRVLEVDKKSKTPFYLLEFEDNKGNKREVELSQDSIISPQTKALSDEQDRIINEIQKKLK